MRAFQSNAGFASLERADPQQLSKFILGEHPQTIALILAHLQPANAAQLATLLPEELRVDVLTRMASLEDISPDVVSRISSVIELRLKALGGPSREQHGGVRAVAELFNRLERTVSTPVLEAIEEQRPELAVSIRNLMFVFDDLLHVDDNGMREIIQRADKKGAHHRAQGRERRDPRSASSPTCRSAPARCCAKRWKCSAPSACATSRRRSRKSWRSRASSRKRALIATGAAAGEAYVV